MPKCFICGKEAKIFAGDKWWCEHHYSLLREKTEKVEHRVGTSEDELPNVDLGLSKI